MPFLDRLGGVFSSTFRPQEALSTQVLAAAVRSVNALRPDAVLVTGDIVDSAERVELDQALAVLDGGRVDPDTGARGYDGVQAAVEPRRPLLPARDRRPAPPGHARRRAAAVPLARARRPVVPGARQPRRARPGRDAADRADRRGRDRHADGRGARPRPAPGPRRRERRRRRPAAGARRPGPLADRAGRPAPDPPAPGGADRAARRAATTHRPRCAPRAGARDSTTRSTPGPAPCACSSSTRPTGAAARAAT